jgi:putative transposase
MSLSAACRLFGISRQAFYQNQSRQQLRLLELQQVKELVIAERRLMPRVGTRKLYYLLENKLKSKGIKLGRDGLFNFLKSENMLVRKKKSYTKTTWSKHWLHKYPNLLKELKPDRPEQVWVSDITYVPTRNGNSYLSLVTDAYSRKIVGYHLSEDMKTENVAKAVAMAIKQRKTKLPLIHHSDRGLQYCAAEYQLLLSNGEITPSMTDGYDCYQNALAERINGILKDEFLIQTYTPEQLNEVVAQSIEIYNNYRPHLSLRYKTPNFIHEKSLGEQTPRDQKTII